MCENYENINFTTYDYAGKSTPVIDIESDDVSTSEQPQAKDINNISPHAYSNWSHCILQRPIYVDDYSLLLLVKINDFRNFLDGKKPLLINKINFYLQKFDRNLILAVKIIPTDENFSVQIQFFEDKQNITEVKFKERKGTNTSKKQDKDSFCLLDEETTNSKNKNINDSYHEEELYSEEFREILLHNEITLDLTMGIYTRAKKYFTRNKKEKLKLNTKNEVYINDYFAYESLIYDNLADPFLFRIKITCEGKIPEKYEESIGISNEGNTCYMNTIIQSFFHIKLLRKAIFRIPSSEESAIYGIQKVFYSLSNEKNSLKLNTFFKSLSWEKSFWNSQQDVQEIFLLIFNIISEQEKLLLDESQLSNLCEGIVNSKVSCVDIVFDSSKQEDFLFLQLDIENSCSLIECVEKFISVESLTGENQYELEDKTKHDATRSFMFSKIPEILFVQLKRFKCDGADIIKVHQRIEYTEQINLADYYSNKVEELNYTLYSVIVHDGSMNSGHYFLFLKDFQKNKWIKFNDTKVTFANESEVFIQNFGGMEDSYQIADDGDIVKIETEILRTAYILIYVQNDKIDVLFQDLKSEDIPDSLIEMLTSNRRYKPTQATNNIRQIDSSFDICEFAKYNLARNPVLMSNQNNTNNINKLKHNGNMNINSKIMPKNVSKPSSRKIKSEDRNPSLGREGSRDKTNDGKAGNYKNKTIQDYANTNSRMKHDQFYIEIDQTSENYSSFKTTLSSTSNQFLPKDSSDNIKRFMTKNEKNLLKTYTFNFIDNKTSMLVEEIKLDKSLEKKITAMEFIAECHSKIKYSQVDLLGVKLMILNKMGFLLRIVDESEDIVDLLLSHKKKKIFLCFYILDFETGFNFNNGQVVCVQVMSKDFESIKEEVDIHKNGHLIKVPIIIKETTMMNNEQEFKKCLIIRLNEIYGDKFFNKEKTNQVNFRVIENSYDALSEVVFYTQVKLSKGFGSYEFFSMAKKDLNIDRFIRLAVELQ